MTLEVVIPHLMRNPFFSIWIPAFAGMTAYRFNPDEPLEVHYEKGLISYSASNSSVVVAGASIWKISVDQFGPALKN